MAKALQFAALVAVLLAVAPASQASEFTSPHVAHLTSRTYEDAINDGKAYFIKFYAPWCGHCKRMADTWKQLGESFKGSDKVAIAHVDCTTDKDICTSAGVKGYPTLKVLYKGEVIKDFRGPRELSSLKKFIESSADEVLTEAD